MSSVDGCPVYVIDLDNSNKLDRSPYQQTVPGAGISSCPDLPPASLFDGPCEQLASIDGNALLDPRRSLPDIHTRDSTEGIRRIEVQDIRRMMSTPVDYLDLPRVKRCSSSVLSFYTAPTSRSSLCPSSTLGSDQPLQTVDSSSIGKSSASCQSGDSDILPFHLAPRRRVSSSGTCYRGDPGPLALAVPSTLSRQSSYMSQGRSSASSKSSTVPLLSEVALRANRFSANEKDDNFCSQTSRLGRGKSVNESAGNLTDAFTAVQLVSRNGQNILPKVNWYSRNELQQETEF